MSSKPKRDITTVWPDNESSITGSGSDHSDSVDAKSGHLVYSERRGGGRWQHRKTAVPQEDGTALLIGATKRSSVNTNSANVSRSGGGGGKLHPTYPSSGGGSSGRSGSNSKKPHQHQALATPARSGRARVVNSLNQEQLLQPDQLLGPGKDETAARGNTYPPIITIDGRVDTDLDYLIDDEDDEDQHYDGPVEEMPSKYPRPHVFSVIHGSLDDDVDSYANDDGTLEHTLVDAPKNFHPKDLKDVASTDTPAVRARPGQTKGGRTGGRTGGRPSHLLSYTDKSHNKMHTDCGEGERPQIWSAEKHQYHHQQQHRQSQQHQEQIKPPRPPPRTMGGRNEGSGRQAFSDEGIPHGQSEYASAAAALSDSYTTVQHRVIPPEQEKAYRKMTHSNRMPPSQPSPGKSVSEQTQKSEVEETVILRRPASCTSKCSGSAQRYGKRCVSPTRTSAARSPQNDDAQVDSNEEEFITCRETTNKSSASLVRKDSRRRSQGIRNSPDRRGAQAFAFYFRNNTRPKRYKMRKGEQVDSDVSSVRGFDSIESDSVNLYDPSLSDDLDSSEKYCSDPLATNNKFSLSDAEMSKSDTRASTDRSSGRRLYRREQEAPVSKREGRQSRRPPMASDAVELYEEVNNAPEQGKTKSPYLEANNIQEQPQILDAKENDSRGDPSPKNEKNLSQTPGQKYFSISKINTEKGFRSKFLIQEMNGQGNEIPKETEHTEGETEATSTQGKRFNEKQTKQNIQGPHVGNTIWQGVEQFRPIHSSRHKSNRNGLIEDNRGFHNTRRGSKSPPRQAKNYGLHAARELERLDHSWRERAKTSRSPTRLEWHGYLSSKDQRREMQLLQKRARLLVENIRSKTSPPKMIGDEDFLLSPKTWNDVDRYWNRRVSKSPERERHSRNTQGRYVPGRSTEARATQRKSPRASWSFDSDQSPVAYRQASRMMPYRKRKMTKNQRDAIARLEGSSVDAVYPLKETGGFSSPKAYMGNFQAKQIGINSTDEELRQSLKQAMEIARQSLSAAARVSKALNLVMTNSCLSLESCSYHGSPTDAHSPKYCNLNSATANQVLRWAQTQRSLSASSRNTDISCVSVHRTGTRKPMSHFSQARGSPEVATSCEEPCFIGRSHVVSVHPETRRSRSMISDRAGVLNIVPNYQVLANKKADGNDPSAPLVSIYIGGGSGLNQEPQQVARVVSNHVHHDKSHVSGSHQGRDCFSKEKTCYIQEEQKTNTFLHEDKQKPVEIRKEENLGFYPIRPQTVSVNMVTAQQKIISDLKLSDSSNSQVYESTEEVFEGGEKPSKIDKSSDGNAWATTSGLNPVPNTEVAKSECENQQDIPTHEDGSVRPGLCSHETQDMGRTLPETLGKTSAKRFGEPHRVLPEKIPLSSQNDIASPRNAIEKMPTLFAHLGPPDSHSAVMSAAITYLTKNPQSFSKRTPPLFRASSPPLSKIILRPDKISPPSSVYSSASEGNQTTKIDQISPCLNSPGSCVDPTGYLTDGSAVDPPKRIRRTDKNANKSPLQIDPRSAQVAHKCPGRVDVSSSKEGKPTPDTDESNYTIIKTKHSPTTQVRYKSNKSKGTCEQDKTVVQDNSTFKSELINSQSRKTRNRKKKQGKNFKTAQSLEAEDTGNPYLSKSFHKDLNNNSARDETVKCIKLAEKNSEDLNCVDNVGAEAIDGGEGAVEIGVSDRNTNQPIYDSLTRLLWDKSPSEALLRSSGANKKDTMAQNGMFAPKHKSRYNRSSSSHRVRKSLCIAMKLADESLSAAARVSQLLNQVVDVYQHRHPMDTEDIARLAVQNHAMIGEILASAEHIKSRRASEIRTLLHGGQARQIEHTPHNVDFIDEQIDMSETQKQRRRHNQPKSRLKGDVHRTPSPRSYREMDRSGDVYRDDGKRFSPVNHSRMNSERSERRKSLSRDARRFREHQKSRSPSHENKRTINRENGSAKGLDWTDERKRSVYFCYSPDDALNYSARRGENSEDKKRYDKHTHIERRHSEELGDRGSTYQGSPRSSLKKRREYRHEKSGQSDHHNRRRLRTTETYSDCEGQGYYGESRNSIRKNHKTLRETKSARECGKYQDQQIQCSTESKQERSEARVGRRASPRSVQETNVKHKVRDKYAQSHKEHRDTEYKDSPRSDKRRAESPKKISRRCEDIRKVGSSVDSPSPLKTKHRSGEKTVSRSPRHASSPELCNVAMKKEKRQTKSYKNTPNSNKTALVNGNISDAEGSPNSGNGDRPQSPDTRSQRNHKRKSRPKSSTAEKKRAGIYESSRPKSTLVDELSAFQKMDGAAASISVPAATTDGQNCSYNRSLDVKSNSENQLCIPIKHRHPSMSDKGKTLLVNWGPPKSQENYVDGDQSPTFDIHHNSLTCVDEMKCPISDRCLEVANKDVEPLNDPIEDDLNCKQTVALPCLGEKIEGKTLNIFLENGCTEEPITQKLACTNSNDLAILPTKSCPHQGYVLANHATRKRHQTSVSSEGCFASASDEDTSTSSSTISAKVHSHRRDTHAQVLASKDIQVKENKIDNTYYLKFHEKAGNTFEDEKNYSLKRANDEGIVDKSYDNGNLCDCGQSYTFYSQPVDTSTTCEDKEIDIKPEVENCLNNVKLHSSNDGSSSSHFSSPEKISRAKIFGRTGRPFSVISRRCEEPHRQDQEMNFPSDGASCEGERTSAALRRESPLHFTEFPKRDVRKDHGNEQAVTRRLRQSSPEPTEDISSSGEGSYETIRPRSSHDHHRGKPEYSSGDSVWSYTVSASWTGAEEDHIGYNHDQSPLDIRPSQQRAASKTAHSKLPHPSVTNSRQRVVHRGTPCRRIEALSASPQPQHLASGGGGGGSAQQLASSKGSEQINTNNVSDLKIYRYVEQTIGDGKVETSSPQENICLDPRKDGVLPETADNSLTGVTGHGIYSLYRPLDNIRTGSFSPIIEESEITAAGLSKPERAFPSSLYAHNSCVSKCYKNVNNCNVNAETAGFGKSYSADCTIHNGSIPMEDVLLHNTNNNSSSNQESSSKQKNVGSKSDEIDQMSNIDIPNKMPRRRRCRSQPVVPEPFCGSNRIPLPPCELNKKLITIALDCAAKQIALPASVTHWLIARFERYHTPCCDGCNPCMPLLTHYFSLFL
ncbi:hypothetical protein ElyMa_002219800 [Elysia marginata]|uniref:Uncharacterized protein n=1 Tax=Elysia marginata TaxID=1093978 RepID=A0AAV4FTM3_9GAST|nr:hypothetical protein ElyMa_002219800 [Elysia marginata]